MVLTPGPPDVPWHCVFPSLSHFHLLYLRFAVSGTLTAMLRVRSCTCKHSPHCPEMMTRLDHTNTTHLHSRSHTHTTTSLLPSSLPPSTHTQHTTSSSSSFKHALSSSLLLPPPPPPRLLLLPQQPPPWPVVRVADLLSPPDRCMGSLFGSSLRSLLPHRFSPPHPCWEGGVLPGPTAPFTAWGKRACCSRLSSS